MDNMSPWNTQITLGYASYFGSSDLTVKCIQSKKKIFACRSNVLFKLISLWLDRKYKSTNTYGMKLIH